jgi:oligopeptide/dipeptide ABC transporter ATP-binding protein
VGESGCGKTSTGKAILKLVEATDGDILLEMPEGDARAYEKLRQRPDDPVARRALDGLRRKYSVTWKENLPWTAGQALLSAGAILAATFLGVFAPSLVLAIFAEPFADPWPTIGLCVSIGLILGLVGSLPPTRLSRRTRVILTLVALGSIIVASVPALYIHRAVVGDLSRFDVGSALATPWTQDLAAMLVGLAFGTIAAGGGSALLLDWRERSEGMAGIHMRSIRRRLQLIFQDPYESLNPKQSVYEIVSEPLAVNRVSRNPGETSALVKEALTDVGLRPPEEFLFRFPHELSGGQRQRVSIAAALVLQPDFIVADEPVSMLDVSIRTEILQVMMELRTRRGITYLFITHDLSLAWVLADRIAVMYLGKIVEMGTTEQVIGHPMHPYTKALISVVPSPDPRHKVERIILKGERPDPSDIPPGCRFHPRCPFAFERCGWTAEEVADQLRSLKAGGSLAGAGEINTSDAGTLRVSIGSGSSARLVQELNALLSEQRDTHLPLKGIAAVHATNSFVELSIHESTEPPLLEIEPGNSVACHLVTSPAAMPEPVTA